MDEGKKKRVEGKTVKSLFSHNVFIVFLNFQSLFTISVMLFSSLSASFCWRGSRKNCPELIQLPIFHCVFKVISGISLWLMHKFVILSFVQIPLYIQRLEFFFLCSTLFMSPVGILTPFVAVFLFLSWGHYLPCPFLDSLDFSTL